MFSDVFSAFLKKIIEHNFLMMYCFFCSVDVVFLISYLEYPKVDKGVAISGFQPRPPRPYYFGFRSLMPQECFGHFDVGSTENRLVHFFFKVFFFLIIDFFKSSQHIIAFFPLAVGAQMVMKELCFGWLVDFLLIFVIFSQIRTRPPRLGRPARNFQSFLRYFWLDQVHK